MADRILEAVRNDSPVCAAFYGHPGVLVNTAHDVISRARRGGHDARMLPGVSAQDCLIADLGIDLVLTGFQSFEATDFLLRKRQCDPSCALILWQVGLLGVAGYYRQHESWNPQGVQLLAKTLVKIYSDKHKGIVYEAPTFPVFEPVIQRVPLSKLNKARITTASLLYVPPSRHYEWDWKMVRRLKSH